MGTDVALPPQISMLDFQAARWLIEHEFTEQTGNDHPYTMPTGVSGRDGNIKIGVAGQGIPHRFCDAIGHADLLDDPRSRRRPSAGQPRCAFNAALSAVTRMRGAARMGGDAECPAGIACGPINGIDQVFADPQVRQASGIRGPVTTSPARPGSICWDRPSRSLGRPRRGRLGRAGEGRAHRGGAARARLRRRAHRRAPRGRGDLSDPAFSGPATKGRP